MSLIVANSISSKAIVLTPTGGSAGVISGGISVHTGHMIKYFPTQLCGFIPLIDCSLDECRSFEGECYLNPVLGSSSVSGSSYENDLSAFFINNDASPNSIFVIQKLDERLKVWNDVATIGSTLHGIYPYVTTYGTYYAPGYFTTHPYYTGVQINWGHVLDLSGAGVYRIKIFSPAVIDGQTKPFPFCMISEPFILRPFSCGAADSTVKFEANQSGRVGSITQDGIIFDLCNMTIYDSVRVKGFFGFETTSYDEIMLEYQSGLMDRVRDEAIQKFDFIGHPMPKYIHDRFKTYGTMADSLFVSDYNANNSDYDIKLKRIVKSSGYEPKYYSGTRLSSVKTQFKEGIQSVIKSSSCQKLRQ